MQYCRNQMKQALNELLSIASFEIAKMRRNAGVFDIEKYVKDYNPEYKDWKTIIESWSKVFVLNEDSDYENVLISLFKLID